MNVRTMKSDTSIENTRATLVNDQDIKLGLDALFPILPYSSLPTLNKESRARIVRRSP